MQAHRTRTTITEDHEIKVRLPPDFPAGEAEVIVIAEPPATVERPGGTPATDFNSWLDGTLRRLPPAPSPPLESLRRENLYEDDSPKEDYVAMKCTSCGAIMLPATSDLPFKVAEQTIVLLKERPVFQCRPCGAYSLEDAVQVRVDAILAAEDEATELEIIRYAP